MNLLKFLKILSNPFFLTEAALQDPKTMTRLLHKSREGDEAARESLVGLIYEELHRMANRHAWKTGETLRPTVLVNEVYLKLFKGEKQYQNRKNLLACAAIAMRQLIINYAEKAAAQKRGGGAVGLTLEDWDGAKGSTLDGLALSQVLERLEQVHPRHAQMISLAYFAGFKQKEIAAMLEVSDSTVEKDLRFAKAWVKKQLRNRQSTLV